MTIFVYADESGVFDQVHQNYFVFGCVIFLDKTSRDAAIQRYRKAEAALGPSAGRTERGELKATTLSNKHKGKLFRSLNPVLKFAVVIDLKRLKSEIFDHKKSKQRFLDYAFKRAVKNVLETLIRKGFLDPECAENLVVVMDEHSTATNGRYELRESLEQELKIGVFNPTWNQFFPPILPRLGGIELTMVDSRHSELVRAADIVANKVFRHANRRTVGELRERVITLRLP